MQFNSSNTYQATHNDNQMNQNVVKQNGYIQSKLINNDQLPTTSQTQQTLGTIQNVHSNVLTGKCLINNQVVEYLFEAHLSQSWNRS